MSILGGIGPAMAAPVYRVTVNTASLVGQSGYLDFLMLGLSGAEPVAAAISNFTGNQAGGSFQAGAVSGSLAGGLSIGNDSPWNEFGQWVNFGAMFRFDLSFAVGTGPGAGTNLGISLLGADWNYLATAGDVVTFALQPGEDDSIFADAALASVTIADQSAAVPEPSVPWLVVLGAPMAGVTGMRRRKAA